MSEAKKKGIEEIKEKLKAKWESLNSETKRKVVLGAGVAIVGLGLFVLFLEKEKNTQVLHNKTADQAVAKTQVAMTQIEAFEIDLLRKNEYQELKLAIEAMKKEQEEIKQKLESVGEDKRKYKDLEGILPPLPPPPPPPPPPPFPSSFPQDSSPQEPPKPVITKLEGGIELVGSETKKKGEVAEEVKEEGSKIKDKKKYLLLPSFMEATLLSGLDAPAISKGEAHPVPVLLRVKTPAVLPNRVKANLKGCFIIAEGLGNLATERADLRLVSLSCIDYQGRAVIDQKIKGFVVDNDGKIGLRGRVVSKMGSVIARSLLAGFLSGFGSSIVSQTQSVSISPSGTLTTIEPGKALQAGLGTGLQSSLQEIAKFYLDLAKQTIPVVEVLPTRNVTVIISEGVELQLKDLE
ncbi:MAG: TraB/VirB10 family protein [Candidatus Bathyarchaeia archaeon]